MNPVSINSGTLTEFLLFPRLPPELRQMVWDEALPTLSFQRFKAEIRPHPIPMINWPAIPGQPQRKANLFHHNNRPESFVLCLTPSDDFVQLTSGYRGLLGACSESRRAAMAKIKCHLPIYYIARNTNGSFAVRSAKVPFNPEGHLCISGLALAFDIQAHFDDGRRLAEVIQCPTIYEIKNLTISIDWSTEAGRIIVPIHTVFSIMTRRMNKLETVALVDERVLNDRHRLDAKDFESLHNPARVVRVREDGGDLDHEPDNPSTIEVPWLQLFDAFVMSVDD